MWFKCWFDNIMFNIKAGELLVGLDMIQAKIHEMILATILMPKVASEWIVVKSWMSVSKFCCVYLFVIGGIVQREREKRIPINISLRTRVSQSTPLPLQISSSGQVSNYNRRVFLIQIIWKINNYNTILTSILFFSFD